MTDQVDAQIVIEENVCATKGIDRFTFVNACMAYVQLEIAVTQL
jgi:hypothetical protein